MEGLFAVPEEAVKPGAPELFEILAQGPEGLVLERIVSNGQTTPPGQWYEQTCDEWVAVLRGSARIAYEDGEEVPLEQGGCLLLPAGRRHRVSYCSSPCIWLALHACGLAPCAAAVDAQGPGERAAGKNRASLVDMASDVR